MKQNERLTAEEIVRANVLDATPSHGRFSQWNGKTTLNIPLSTLRVALRIEGETEEQAAKAKQQIAELLTQAHPTNLFTSWAGASGRGACAITVEELKIWVQS